MTNIYYIVGSYSHPIGSVDYINALKVFFKRTNPKINLILSTKIIRDSINIFLESFNDQYISYMKEFKDKYPNTKYIIICTEFMQFNNKKIVFNCFNNDDFEQENQLSINENFFDIKNSGLTNSKFLGTKIINKTKRVIENNFPTSKNNSFENNSPKYIISDRRREYHDRANCLSNILKYADILIGAHPEITKFLKGLQKIAFDFPYFVDDINIEVINKKLKGFYMGGTLNQYRKDYINNKGKFIINIITKEIEETYIGQSNNPLYTELRRANIVKLILQMKLKADLEDLSKELNNEIISKRKSPLDSNTLNALNNIEVDLFPENLDALLKNYIIYYQSTSIDLPHLLYELYIPQSKQWPYSSPMRFWHTFMNNGIPVTFTKYNDHELNMLVKIYKDDMDLNLVDYLEKVNSYNLSQSNLYKSINNKIEEFI
tara:strand:+ start:1605 stop:2900 length:1296 start_codon:yes stop_codon:yes gene_type:complete